MTWAFNIVECLTPRTELVTAGAPCISWVLTPPPQLVRCSHFQSAVPASSGPEHARKMRVRSAASDSMSAEVVDIFNTQHHLAPMCHHQGQYSKATAACIPLRSAISFSGKVTSETGEH